MPTKPFATDKYKEPTGRDWAEWLKFAQKEKLADLPHNEIALRLGEAGVPDWWAQNLAVAFEQHIGRRAPGQVGDSFRTQVNRTVAGERAEVASRWAQTHAKTKKIGGIAIEGTPTISDTPKRSYWRINLVDGSKVQVAFEPRPGGKTMINATIDRLKSADMIEEAKVIWKELLARSSG